MTIFPAAGGIFSWSRSCAKMSRSRLKLGGGKVGPRSDAPKGIGRNEPCGAPRRQQRADNTEREGCKQDWRDHRDMRLDRDQVTDRRYVRKDQCCGEDE